MSNPPVCPAAFLDLAKAFDSVDHNILLYRFSSIGLSKSCINWFASCLYNRVQWVKSENVVSDTKHLSRCASRFHFGSNLVLHRRQWCDYDGHQIPNIPLCWWHLLIWPFTPLCRIYPPTQPHFHREVFAIFTCVSCSLIRKTVLLAYYLRSSDFITLFIPKAHSVFGQNSFSFAADWIVTGTLFNTPINFQLFCHSTCLNLFFTCNKARQNKNIAFVFPYCHCFSIKNYV